MIALTDWESAWRFLSLDDTKRFFTELWLPFSPDELQPALRKTLARRCDDDVYHDGYGIVHAELTAAFIDLYGGPGFQYLCTWVADRYLHAGTGPEHQWWRLFYDLSRLSVDDDDRAVMEVVVTLVADMNLHVDRLGRSLAVVFSESEPEWDAKIRTVYDGLERAGSEAVISLIGRGNAFVCAWERRCASVSEDQLRRLFFIGRSIAPPALAVDLAFPGSWRAELSCFLENESVCAGAHRVS